MSKVYHAPIGSWDMLNDVEAADDGNMYYAILEHQEPDEYGITVRRLTGYDLTREQAFAAMKSHNSAIGLWHDSMGFWYKP